MKPEEEEKITQWIDGELKDDEVRKLLNDHPELADLKQSATDTGSILREGLDSGKELPYADFFNHRIRQRLEEEESSIKNETISLKEEAEYLPLFTRSRLLAGLVFAALAITIIVRSLLGPDLPGQAGRTEIVDTYTPNPDVQASTHYDEEAKAIIIELNGLEEIPANTEISGIFPLSYEPDASLAATTLLRSRDTNKPIAILENDHRGRPSVRDTNL